MAINSEELARLFEEVLSRYQRKPISEPGILGDGNGLVAVSGRPLYVWARMLSTPNVPIQVYNDRTSYINELPVFIGYDPDNPNLLQVLKPRLGLVDQGGNSIHYNVGVSAHARSHQWMDPNGGQDVVYIHLRQWLPLRVSPAGGLTVKFYPAYAYCADSGVYEYIAPPNADLSAYQPAAGLGRWILMALTSAGAIRVTVGTSVSIYSLALSDIPSITFGDRPLAAVRVYGGQVNIAETRSTTDIIDLRFPLATGEGSGLSAGLVSATNPGFVPAGNTGIEEQVLTIGPGGVPYWADSTGGGSGGAGASTRRLARVSALAGATQVLIPDLGHEVYRVSLQGFELDPALWSFVSGTNTVELNTALAANTLVIIDYEARTV